MNTMSEDQFREGVEALCVQFFGSAGPEAARIARETTRRASAMIERRASYSIQEKCALLRAAGLSVDAIMDETGCPRRSVYRYIRNYSEAHRSPG